MAYAPECYACSERRGPSHLSVSGRVGRAVGRCCEEFEIAVQLAAYYVADATEGRLDNGLASNFKSGNKRKLYCCLVQTHIAWHAARPHSVVTLARRTLHPSAQLVLCRRSWSWRPACSTLFSSSSSLLQDKAAPVAARTDSGSAKT